MFFFVETLEFQNLFPKTHSLSCSFRVGLLVIFVLVFPLGKCLHSSSTHEGHSHQMEILISKLERWGGPFFWSLRFWMRNLPSLIGPPISHTSFLSGPCHFLPLFLVFRSLIMMCHEQWFLLVFLFGFYSASWIVDLYFVSFCWIWGLFFWPII